MYRIMLAKSKRPNCSSLYQFMTTTIDGETYYFELPTKKQLDAYVEKMLNKNGYAKDDFVVVQVVNYTINATDYSDSNEEEDSETENKENTEEEDNTTGEDTTNNDCNCTCMEDYAPIADDEISALFE